MTYQEAKTQNQQAQQASKDAQATAEQAKDNLRAAEQAVEDAYEALTQTMAEAEAGDAAASDVSDARATHQEAQQDLEEAKIALDAKRKSVDVFARKARDAQQAQKEAAFTYCKEKAEPLAQRMIDAMETLQSINEEVQAFREQASKDGLTPSKFIPPAFEKVELPVKHLRDGYSLEKWRNEVESKNPKR